MKNLINTATIIIGLLFIGCEGNQNKFSDKEVVFEKYTWEPDIQYFSCSSDEDTVLIGKQGTILNLKGGSYSIDSALIIIELIEFYSISDMVLNGLSTLSNGNILETEGMFYIDIKSEDGNPVYLEDSKCSFQTPKQEKKENVILFKGEFDENGQINWDLKDVVMGISYEEGDTLPEFKNYVDQAYFFELTSLGWVNCDKFMEAKEKTNVLVHSSNDEGSYSLIVKNFNSIIPGILNENGDLSFEGIPDNQSISIVGMAKRNDKLYYGILGFNSNDSNLTSPEYKEIGVNELKSLLEDKFGTVL